MTDDDDGVSDDAVTDGGESLCRPPGRLMGMRAESSYRQVAERAPPASHLRGVGRLLRVLGHLGHLGHLRLRDRSGRG